MTTKRVISHNMVALYIRDFEELGFSSQKYHQPQFPLMTAWQAQPSQKCLQTIPKSFYGIQRQL